MDKVLQQCLKKQNFTFGFRVCRIWPLNFVAMVGKFCPNEVFIATKEENPENSYHSNTIMQTNDIKMKLKLPHNYCSFYMNFSRSSYSNSH
jgi:hypothetical protein